MFPPRAYWVISTAMKSASEQDRKKHPVGVLFIVSYGATGGAKAGIRDAYLSRDAAAFHVI